MNAMAPCPSNSNLMQAWDAYQATDDFKNSYSWATRYIPDDDTADLERIRASGANPVTKEMKINFVKGSLWAAFMRGWQQAGGADPFERTDPGRPVPKHGSGP